MIEKTTAGRTEVAIFATACDRLVAEREAIIARRDELRRSPQSDRRNRSLRILDCEADDLQLRRVKLARVIDKYLGRIAEPCHYLRQHRSRLC